MSLVVNTNLSSLQTMNNLSKANSQLTLHMQRLSSGLRINNAGDDAAGLALSDKLQSQVNASDIAKNNSLTGISMLQIADADLAQITENIQRMRDLAVQSANGTYSATERTALNSEYTNRITEVTKIINSSAFGNVKLLDGSSSPVVLQIGTNNVAANDQLSVTLAALAAPGGTIDTQANAQTAINTMSAYLTTVTAKRATIGAAINTLQDWVARTDAKKTNLASATSVLKDADVAAESAALTKSQILVRSTTAMLQQANQIPSLALSLIQS